MGSFFLANCSTQDRSLSCTMASSLCSQAIEAFQRDPPTTVFLLSMRSGAVGINLTAANHVFHPGACHEPRAGGPGRRPSLPHGPDTAGCGEEALHQGACCQQCPLASFHPVLISNPKSHVDSSMCTCYLGTRTAHIIQYDGGSPGKSGLLTCLLTCRGR